MKFLLLIILNVMVALGINAQEAIVWDYTSEAWTKGKGSSADPFLIEKPSHLAYLARQVNAGEATFVGKYFRMENNFDLSGNEDALFRLEWIPIGSSLSSCFNGNFDGNGKIITNMSVGYEVEQTYAGLFGVIGSNGRVTNLGIMGNSRVKGVHYVGSVAGYCDGYIGNCYNTGCVGEQVYIYAQVSAGGIVGKGAVVDRCYNTARVNGLGTLTYMKGGAVFVGGIAGEAKSVTSCYNKGAVEADIRAAELAGDASISGIVGKSTQNILNCYNTGKISIIQRNSYSGSGIYVNGIGASPLVENCYSIGKYRVEQENYQPTYPDTDLKVYPIGNNMKSKPKVLNCHYDQYWNETLSSKYYQEKVEGEARSEEQMTNRIFATILNNSQEPKVWEADLKLENGGYPVLVSKTGPSTGNETIVPDKSSEILVSYSVAEDRVTLKCMSSKSNLRIKMFNAGGALVYSSMIVSFEGQEATINTQGFQKGVYFLCVSDHSVNNTFKLFVR